MKNNNLLHKPIIFIGMGRCGSTIISEIVFQHEDLAWPSNYQNKFPSNVEINYIRLLLDNKFWKLSGQKEQLNKVPFYNRFAFMPTEAYSFWKELTGAHIDFSRGFLLEEKVTEEECTSICDFFEKMVKYQDRKRLAFKITGPGRIGYLHSIFPDAIFVEITRKPFANIRSLLKVSFWKDRAMHQLWWRGAYSEEEQKQVSILKDKPALLTAFQYKKVRDKTQEEVAQHQVEHLVIAYEDFIQNPAQEINKILEKTGLHKSKVIDRYLEKNKIFNRNVDAKTFFSEEEQEKIKKITATYLD